MQLFSKWMQANTNKYISYRILMHPFRGKMISVSQYYICKSLNNFTGNKLLDVGMSRIYSWAKFYRHLGYRVYGVDPFINETYKGDYHCIYKGEAQYYDFNEKFEIIIFMSTLEHIGKGAYGEPARGYLEANKCLIKMENILKQNGKILIQIPFAKEFTDREFEWVYNQEKFDEILKGTNLIVNKTNTFFVKIVPINYLIKIHDKWDSTISRNIRNRFIRRVDRKFREVIRNICFNVDCDVSKDEIEKSEPGLGIAFFELNKK